MTKGKNMEKERAKKCRNDNLIKELEQDPLVKALLPILDTIIVLKPKGEK